MLKGYEKLRIPDENKEHEMVWEVNWNPHDPKTTGCKVIRVTFPGGQTAIVKKEHMMAAVFAIADAEEQVKMIPVQKTLSRWYETIVSVKATKDVKKGEELTFPIKLSLPAHTYDVLAEAKKDLVKQGFVAKK